MTEYLRENPRKTVPFVTSGMEKNCYWIKCERAEKAFEGQYQITLKNEKGEEAKSSANLTVTRHEPMFVEELSPIRAQVGRKVQMECQINDPEQEVTWRVADKTVENGKTFKIESDEGRHSLRFVAQLSLDGATISCAMNDADFARWGLDSQRMKTVTSCKLTVTEEGNFLHIQQVWQIFQRFEKFVSARAIFVPFLSETIFTFYTLSWYTGDPSLYYSYFHGFSKRFLL